MRTIPLTCATLTLPILLSVAPALGQRSPTPVQAQSPAA